MRWAILAPFFSNEESQSIRGNIWIDDFDDSGRYEYHKVSAPAASLKYDWHVRNQRSTPFLMWLKHWRHSRSAFLGDCDGLITVFPQLAIAAAIRRMLTFSSRKTILLAWCFNVGKKPRWPLARIAGFVLSYVTLFVVHSRGEIDTLHDWFGIPKRKIVFVPLQKSPIILTISENTVDPFVVAMGSANRDYETLIKAVRGLPIRLIIVASSRSVAGIDIPENVEILSGVTSEQCRTLAQEARINIVPLANVETASGQVTIVEALRMGRPLIATKGVGSVDYISNGYNGILVEPRDINGMRSSILNLYNDENLRQKLARNAIIYSELHLSDEAAAKELTRILDKLSPKSIS